MSSLVKNLLRDQNVKGQLTRFVLTGGFITISGAAVYWVLAQAMKMNPFIAMTVVYIAFFALGYLLHSKVSFWGYGSRDKMVQRSTRFLLTNALGWAINNFFVWLLVEYAQGPNWWPILPFIFVTPAISFMLNRIWVFR